MINMDDEERDEEAVLPFDLRAVALQNSEFMVELLSKLKQEDAGNGRLWAIAMTDAEKLHAWISYAVATVDTTDE